MANTRGEEAAASHDAPSDTSAALWTSAEAAAATGGRARGRWTATGVAIDSRTLKPGDLFVALKDARDGHDFVASARAGGAAAALVERGVDEGPALIVPDALDALRGLAVAARARSAAIRVAVTGSVRPRSNLRRVSMRRLRLS